MLHWLHSVYNSTRGGGMCAATCSMWWLGWILYKTTQLEGSYQSGGTWSTGAALVSPPTKEEKKQNPTLWHSNKNKHRAVRRWWPWLFFLIFFLLPSASAFFRRGSLPSQSYKANRVVWTWGGIRVNMGCCDVCAEWVTVCGGHSWYWACGAIFFPAGWDVLRSLVPHPGLTCWAMTTKQMASIAAHGDPWPLGFELPCREGLFEKPSRFNNIFSPGAAKALSCLTPVAPSVELRHNCSYLPYILTQCAVVCHACSLDTWMQQQFVRFLWGDRGSSMSDVCLNLWGFLD